MKVKATKSFCGPLCMAIGEIREITDKDYLADLLQAGYVVPVGPAKQEKPAAPVPVEPAAEPAAPAAEAEAPKAEAPKRGSRKKAVSAK